jgi:hypothetical protein
MTRVNLMTIASKQRSEAESRVCATLRFIGTRVQGRPCQGAHQGAHCRELSTLEKSRVLFEGAQGVQGAHLDLSTLENPWLRLRRLESANCVRYSCDGV